MTKEHSRCDFGTGELLGDWHGGRDQGNWADKLESERKSGIENNEVKIKQREQERPGLDEKGSSRVTRIRRPRTEA